MEAEEQWIEQAWQEAISKIQFTSRRIGSTFPHVSQNGHYDNASLDWWTNGFWPGILWLVYRETQDERLKESAVRCEESLDKAVLEFVGLHHDVGFMWMTSAVAHYKLLGDIAAKRRGLLAATLLAGRFNPAGQFIRSWGIDTSEKEDTTGWVIIDSLMNLNILYWASAETEDPRFRVIAELHADKVAQNFIHPDGSCRHIAQFHPKTGEFLRAHAGQGARADSAWARGCAWAIHGFALNYGYTGKTQYLDVAQKAANFFLENLPGDKVPFWDFKLHSTQHQPRDSSAAACAASGLIELSRHMDNPVQKQSYLAAAKSIVRSLYGNYYSESYDEDGLVLHATGNYPAGQFVDCPIIYGDYFYLEALAKLRGASGLF